MRIQLHRSAFRAWHQHQPPAVGITQFGMERTSPPDMKSRVAFGFGVLVGRVGGGVFGSKGRDPVSENSDSDEWAAVPT